MFKKIMLVIILTSLMFACSKTNPISKQPSTDLAHKGMVFIEGGTFDMGDVTGEGAATGNEALHKAGVSSFYMGQTEVTFNEYDLYCKEAGIKKPDDSGWGRGKKPVINVSWYDAVEYCNWLSVKNGLTPCYTIDKTMKDPDNTNTKDTLKWIVNCDFKASGYRLPTEAEWEYAAREKGKKIRFANGKDIADPKEINFDGDKEYKTKYSVGGTFRKKTTLVASFKPNSLGLYDMSGNLWEWCWDWIGAYPKTEEMDYTGLKQGAYRALRGGSWFNYSPFVRVSIRNSYMPYFRNFIFGFRVACSAR